MTPSLLQMPVAFAPAPSAPPTVLIADADPMRRAELAALCRGFGWVPALAVDALQAVTLASRGCPALVVLHAALPAGNGVGALERILRLPGCLGLPALMIGVPEHDLALTARCRAAARDVIILADAAPSLVVGVLCALLPVDAAARMQPVATKPMASQPLAAPPMLPTAAGLAAVA